jgi:phosphopantetheinyl transferase
VVADSNVGIDLEVLNGRCPTINVTNSSGSAQCRAKRVSAFYSVWTAKEALMTAFGENLWLESHFIDVIL